MKNFFSIIMPAYNAESTISESITSVLNQNYFDYELIVINDGSQDNTKECVEKFRNEKIFLLNVNNGGVSNARNLGIINSSGKYICFLDSDDIWMDDHLSTLNDLITKYPSYSAFCTGYQIKNFNGKYSYPLKKDLSKLNGDDFVINNYFEFQRNIGNFVHINSFCVKKDILLQTGLFQPHERFGEDTDFLYKIFSRYSLVISKKITSEYRRNTTSVTAKRVFNYNWCFLNSYKKLLDDENIKSTIKKDILMIINQYKISAARNKILEGSKKEAFEYLKSVDKNLINKKNYYITLLLLFLPISFSNIAVNIRDRGYNEK